MYRRFQNERTVRAEFATLEDVEKEISEITKAIQNGEGAYKLKYNADVEDTTFGSPKLKKR